jgi:hypothetical protein
MAKSTGAYSSAEGNGSSATGNPSHAEGSGTLASGLNSHSEGSLTVASGVSSHAGGAKSTATRVAQLARASGAIAVVGDAQCGQEYLMLQTLDEVAHILLIGGAGGSLFVLEDNKSYNYEILVVARDNAGLSSAFSITGGCKRVAGVTSQIGAVPAAVNVANDGGVSAVWTATAGAVVGTNSLDITVTTGGAAQTVNWMAVIDWVETMLAPA